MNTVEDHLMSKLSKLEALLQEMQSVLLAYSGGTDSTLLLKVAHTVLGENMLAVTALSALTPRREKKDAEEMVRLINANHVFVDSDDLSNPLLIANNPDKCYHCKKRCFDLLKKMAAQKGFKFVVDGTNRDDFSDYRPGMNAIQELGIRSPLSEAGLRKTEIRQLSRHFKLPTWDKPASACLASRVPYGTQITVEKLKQIDAGETYLHSLGISRQVRVRHHGAVARIEVASKDFNPLLEETTRYRIVNFFKKIGFQFVALDMEGYTMGSLNREIVPREGNQNG